MTGWEAGLINAAAISLANIITDIRKEGVKRLGKFAENINDNLKQVIFNASRQYVETYGKRHGIIRVLGMRDPVSLEEVYTNVQLLEEKEIYRFESLEALEKTFRESQRRFNLTKTPKQIGIDVANQKQYLMVLGSPGSGKSTFLRKMGLEALKGQKGKLKHKCIPVFLELKQFIDRNMDLETEIVREFEVCGFPSPKEFTADALAQGKLLILLDGLDEVPTKNLNLVIDKIQDFVDKYNKNRFIASCRIAAYRSKFRRFSDVTMADFDDSQIQQYISNWFQSETDKQAGTASKCWELLQKAENVAAKELAQTPLLLTFLCLVYDKSQGFPDRRSQLYRKALRILLEEWASEKRLQREDIFQGLHTELEEMLLSEIAYQGFQTDRLFFPQKEIVEQIKTFLTGNLNAPQHLNGEAVLNAIAVQQGILVERAEEIYSFSHLTLQEYLTAEYIADNRLFEQLATERLTDSRWREVFLLVAGLMRGGADDFLLLMEKEAQNFINTSKLSDLLRWADRITAGSEGDIKPVGKRAIAIVLALAINLSTANPLAYYVAYLYADDYVNALANALTNAEVNAYASAFALVFAKVNAFAEANADADADADADAYADNSFISFVINYVGQFEKFKVFNNVNFSILLARLESIKSKIAGKNQPLEVRINLINETIKTLLEDFDISSEMINLSQAEVKELENYLYVNHLIVQCQKAAVRVSPQTWEAIEDRMLRVPDNL